MKRILKMTAFAIVLLLGGSLGSTLSAQYNDDPYYNNGQNNGYNNGQNNGYNDGQNYGQDREVSYQTFYDELSDDGRWVEYPGQGYVWVPDAGPDFRPYSTNGHWVYTDDYEWMWVSDYDWGWAPFHYGRWDNDPAYGWYWVPGYEWSPAWVAWRDGGDYYGWAPIRPGININVNFNIGGYAPPVDFWCFTPRRYITSPRLYDYCIDPRRNVSIIHSTTIIINNYRYSNNYGFRSGPRRYDAERYIGRINPVRLRSTYSPGRTTFRNNEVSVYRPRVRQQNNSSYQPRRFDRYDANASNRTNSNGNVFRRSDNNPVNTDNKRRFERTDDPERQQQQQQTQPRDRNRFESPNNNTREVNNDRRVLDRNISTESTNNGRFERKNDDQQRQQQEQQRRVEASRQQQFEQQRRNDDAVKQQREQKRRSDDAMNQQREQQRRSDDVNRQQQAQQQQSRRFERNDQAQRPQQVERKFEARQQSPQPQQQEAQQQQPRKFERNDGGGNNGNGNDGRNSKRRIE